MSKQKDIDQQVLEELRRWVGRRVIVNEAVKTNGQGLYNFEGLVTQINIHGSMSISVKIMAMDIPLILMSLMR